MVGLSRSTRGVLTAPTSGLTSVRLRPGVTIRMPARNAYDFDPADRKAGDPNDILAAGGRWTFVLGVARVRGFWIASSGEFTITTTLTTFLRSPVQEATDARAAGEITHQEWQEVMDANPPDEYSEGVTTSNSFIKGLMGLAIGVVPESPLEIWGALNTSTGLLIADYLSDGAYALENFEVLGHSGLSTQSPPAILAEIDGPLDRDEIIAIGPGTPDHLFQQVYLRALREVYADGNAVPSSDENAYRGRLTATVTCPTDLISPTGIDFIIAVPPLRAGQFTNPNGLVKTTFIGFHGSQPYPENSDDWDSPPQTGAIRYGNWGPMVDPRNGARFAYEPINWLDTSQSLLKYEIPTRTLVQNLEINDFNTDEADWDNLYLKGPSGRFYWRYGSELWFVLEDSGYFVGAIYGEDSLPPRDSIAVLSLDTGKIVAESLYTFDGTAGFNDDPSTPKALCWVPKGDGSYRFMYYAALGENLFVVADWTPGNATIDFVQGLSSAQTVALSSPDPDDPGSFWYTNTISVRKYDFATNSHSEVVSQAALGASSPSVQLWWIAYRKPPGASVGYIVTLLEGASEIKSWNAETGALVDTLATTLTSDAAGEFMSTGTSPWIETETVGIIGVGTSPARTAVVTVATDGTLTAEECEAPTGSSIADSYQTYTPGTGFLSADATSSLELPWLICPENESAGEAFTLGYWIEQVGLNFLNWVDVSASTLTDTLYGYQSDDVSFQRDLQDLREVFDFYIDDHNGVVTCARATESATADVTLTIADMVNQGAEDRAEYVRTRVAEPDTLPHGVQIEFTDAERLYIRRYAEPAVWQDGVLSPNRIRKYSIPFAMLEKDVKALQFRLLTNLHVASTTYALTVQSANMDITPGTIVQFPMSSNSEYLYMGEVVTATMREGDTQELVLKGALIDKAVEVDPSPIAATPHVPVWANQSTIYIHLDIPFQDDPIVDYDGGGIIEYGVLTSDAPYYWDGGKLLRSDDGGTTFREVHSQAISPFWGTVATPLGSYDYTQGMDETTTLVVQMVNGSLSDLQVLTEQQAAEGAVKLAYGRPGRWEILYPRSMVHAGSGVVNVTDFYRGQEGTDWAINSHQAGDYAVIIDRERLARQVFRNFVIDIAAGDVTSSRQYKALGSLQSPSAVTATTQALSGASHIPYAVSDFAAARAGSPSVLTLSGVRRDRFPPLDAFDAAPNSDRDDTRSPPVNTFILRIYTANSPPDRTVTVETDDNPTYDYSDADQTTDFGAPLAAGDEITLSWQQVRIMDDGRELYGRVRLETVVVTE